MPSSGKSFTYDVDLVWAGGRESTVSAGRRPDIAAAPPEDFPHGDPERWSPEHLFLGALSSCTMLSFLSHAEHRGVEVRSYAAAVTGTISRRETDGRYAFSEVRLRPTVTVASGHLDTATGLTDRAERDCFVSASTTADVRTEWDIREA